VRPPVGHCPLGEVREGTEAQSVEFTDQDGADSSVIAGRGRFCICAQDSSHPYVALNKRQARDMVAVIEIWIETERLAENVRSN
jgi:hypothetical protein